MAEQQQRERREKPANSDFYRPNESDRLERAKEWLRVARGESESGEVRK